MKDEFPRKTKFEDPGSGVREQAPPVTVSSQGVPPKGGGAELPTTGGQQRTRDQFTNTKAGVRIGTLISCETPAHPI